MAHEHRKSPGKVRNAFYLLFVLVSAVLIYFAAFRGMSFFRVPSASMSPTLLPDDYILTLEESSYRRGDVVVIKDPHSKREFLVKRIVGEPGDVIEVHGGALSVNGEYASEPYVSEPMDYEFGPVEVPEGHLLLLGDNRNDSDDSHTHGETFPISGIIGKVRFIYLPPSRMGAFASYPLTNAVGQ